MSRCRNDNTPAGRVGRRLEAVEADEEGAVVMLCLAAVLVLLLMSWVVLDAIFVSYDKGEVQASADVAAHSQASVEARAMNMLAFTNVAKRSLVGTHAVYEAMNEAYARWIDVQKGACLAEQSNCERFRQNMDLYYAEQGGDYATYRGNRDYYMADLRALDTYQRYLRNLTPWWGWSEAVMRAQRNGATLATSFPPPPAYPDDDPGRLAGAVARQVRGDRASTPERSATLPVETGQFWATMVEDGMDDRGAWQWEHRLNVGKHWSRSERGAANPGVVVTGATQMMDVGLHRTREALGEYGRPMRLQRYDREVDWLFDTSNIVLTYRGDRDYFGSMRDKYGGLGEDVEDRGRIADREAYRPGGLWGMARAEMSFQAAGHPDLWRSAWTARMRPVALPGEFEEAGYDFNAIYQAGIEHLMLSGRIHDAGPEMAGDVMKDLIYMERAARGMGASTIEGVGR